MPRILESSNGYLNEQDLKNEGFRSLGKNILVHENVNFHNIKNIALGDNIRIDCYVSIIATNYVTIGSFVHIGSFCYLGAAHEIILDDFSGLSQSVKIYTRNDDYSGEFLTNPTIPSEFLGGKGGIVHLKKHVIIGSGSIILPGVNIEEGSAVGALSLVTGSLGEWGIYGGVPAKKIKDRSKKLLDLEKKIYVQIES